MSKNATSAWPATRRLKSSVSATSTPADRARRFQQQIVARRLHVGDQAELPDGQPRRALGGAHGVEHVVEMELLAGDVEHVPSFAHEGQLGRAAPEAAHFDDVVEVVAVE